MKCWEIEISLKKVGIVLMQYASLRNLNMVSDPFLTKLI